MNDWDGTCEIPDSRCGRPFGLEGSSPFGVRSTEFVLRNSFSGIRSSESILSHPLTGLRLRESPHRGAEYIDDPGRTDDALGDPRASPFWDEGRFLNSIDHHLLESNDFTVIDLTGFTPAQIAVVRGYVNGLPQASRARIIRIGF